MSARNRIPAMKKGYKGIGMEGFFASWYARNTGKSPGQYTGDAREVSLHAPAGSAVLEVAPGPGYLLIELAKLGRYRAAGLDISRTFVAIARENARDAGADIEFLLGNASAMPFCADTFDFIICRAAFMDFSEPVKALREMRRVLKPGGTALVVDLRRDATKEAVDAEVEGLGLGWWDAMVTKWIFRYGLVPRAYTKEEFRRFIEEAGFREYEIGERPIRFGIRLEKPPGAGKIAAAPASDRGRTGPE